ncbi:MAG: hypothetical protein MUO63_20470, partial [Desulfobulbaceae bacterium]|nr:hypothetical protein [Desulfobulbaceae bacterium]
MEICPEVKSLVQLKLDLNISSRKGKAAICMEKHKKKTWPAGQVLGGRSCVVFWLITKCISFWFTFNPWAATQ